MKTLARFLIAAVLTGTSPAGEATFYNDQTYPRFVRISHKRQKLVVTWLLPGQRVTVNIDENRPGKPILMVDSLQQVNSRPEWTVKAFPLPKKSTPLFFNLSWFGKRP